MRWNPFLIANALLLLFALAIFIPVSAAETVYRGVDGEGLDITQGTPPSEDVFDLIDVIEAWIEVDGGVINTYIKIASSSFIDIEENRYAITYLVGALLSSGGAVKNFTVEWALNPGVEQVVCRLDWGDEAVENLGSAEIVELNPVVMRLTCNFDGESFTSPPEDQKLFRVVATLVSAVINEGIYSGSDLFSLESVNVVEGPTRELPGDSISEPGDEVKEGGEEVEGTLFDMTYVYIGVGIVVIGGVAYYFLKMRG